VLSDEARVLTQVWLVRERTEREAQALFAGLASDLGALDVDPVLAGMARQAAADERRHARRCLALVARFAARGAAPAPLPRRHVLLGAPELDTARRALYASVALSCVTETLATALLLELRRRATDAAVRATVHEVLRDEVDHARLGWAHLAAAARAGDVAWLAPHIPAMLRAALGGQLAPAAEATNDPDLSGYGLLPQREVFDVARAVAADVLFPGLERFGVDTSSVTVHGGAGGG
jgi:hypothetical protein